MKPQTKIMIAGITFTLLGAGFGSPQVFAIGVAVFLGGLVLLIVNRL